MAEQTPVLAQLDMSDTSISSLPQRGGYLPLLPRREQDIARHAHDQRRRATQRLQPLDQVLGWLLGDECSRARLARPFGLLGRAGQQFRRRLVLLLVRRVRQREVAEASLFLLLGRARGEAVQLPRVALAHAVEGPHVLVAQVEQVHGLAHVQQAVGVVLETPLLAGVVEVGFDEEVGAQGGRLAGVGPPAAEALLPLGPAAVGDGGDFAGQLHARVRRDRGVVVSARRAPGRVVHQHLALRVAHGDAVGVAAGAAAHRDDFTHARGLQHAGG